MYKDAYELITHESSPFEFDSEFRDVLHQGFDKTVIKTVADEFDMDVRLLQQLIYVTGQWLSKHPKLNNNHTERLLAITSLLIEARECFTSNELMNNWLGHTNFALGGVRPIELIDTFFGIERVRNIVGRLQYGMTA